MADPTRTCVAPKEIAFSKSSDIPIESPVNPLLWANFFNKAKCKLTSSSTGGIAIKPAIGRPFDRQSNIKVSKSFTRIPAF